MPGANPPERKKTPQGAQPVNDALQESVAGGFLTAVLTGLKDRLSSLTRRLAFHAVALFCAFLIDQESGRNCFHAYIGLLCLIPQNFSPKDIRLLFPTVIGLGHLFPLCAWGGFSPGQALFVAGLQSWLLSAIIRCLRLGWDWLVFPFLILGAVGMMHGLFPLASFAFATLCGTAAYACAERCVPKTEQADKAGAEQKPIPEKKQEFTEFEASIALLRKKKKRLPPALQNNAELLIKAAGAILDDMREDPEDRSAGMRFLARYLPAAHTILDEHIRLNESAQHAHVQESLENGAAMLERLSAAFQKEHAHLLRNDAMRFNAEMHTLDKLLKMDGR